MTASLESATTTPVIDDTAIERFVAVLFEYLDGFVPVRVLSEKGTSAQPPHSEYCRICALPNELRRLAPAAAQEARGLFIVPATVASPGSARARDIIQTGVIVVDLDEGDVQAARDHLARYLGNPTLEVASGGTTDAGQQKTHLYWRLNEAACGGDLERVRKLREIIASRVGGDPSFKSLHQPIRVPGTIHGKHGTRTTVRIIADRALEYDLVDLEEAVATMPGLRNQTGSEDNTTVVRKETVKARDLAMRRIREKGVDGITRYAALSKVIGHWIRTHRHGQCSIEEAWCAVRDHNAAMISPPWDQARLRREFQALLDRDIESHGPLSAVDQGPQPKPASDLTPRSEDALALEFVDRHGREWKKVAAWGKWFRWTEGLWLADETGQVRELVRRICREVARTADNPNEAKRIASDRTIAAVARIAAADPRVATHSSDWDAHPWLLNTPAGVVELRTGEIIPHDPALLITQMTAASPGTGCPRWLAFLSEITGGDVDLQSYLARLAGYCLTGSTSEQTFAFLHGTGANGKSVFLRTISEVLGDYAATATNDAFLASRTERHLTELAGLRAARLVMVPETEQGRTWAEARIKAVTGGEKIRANFMRRDHFEFTPRFKLIVAGNHRPALTGVGAAMRRRLHFVPFNVTIPVERRDKSLGAKFLKERDGILGWMLEGCAEWQRIGLAPPDSVQAAGDEYFTDEDIIGQWIDECCVVGAEHRATARELFANWSGWAEQAGHAPGSQKSLGVALRERGFGARKVNGQRGWIGLSAHGRSRAGGSNR